MEHLLLTNRLLCKIPKGRRHYASQLDRAASSINANIAEGAGEFSPAEKARFYRMALRSANECGALHDMCTALGFFSPEDRHLARQVLHRVIAILTALVRANSQPTMS